MHRLYLWLIVIISASAVLAQEESPVIFRESLPAADTFAFETVVDNLIRPLYVTHANDDSGRLFIVEQRGRINVLDGEDFSIFMDISTLVSPEAGGMLYTERGLLGLAFHPDYADNGQFFVNYTDRDGHTVVARYHVSDDATVADADSAEIIFSIEQPYANHNGGHMAFGADGYLYISLGDGGSANDPLASGQNLSTLLGTIIRLDVDTTDMDDTAYAIPSDNPFVDGEGAPEIWSYGLRNVWRFSFDRATADLYLGDVGQNQWEEINFQAADSTGGINYGWNAYEGSHIFAGGVDADAVVMPIAEYDHSLGCSVTGGYVYRGTHLVDWQGIYFYGDYCTGRIWGAYRTAEDQWQSALIIDSDYSISSFGEDQDGELYLVNYGGSLLKLVPSE